MSELQRTIDIQLSETEILMMLRVKFPAALTQLDRLPSMSFLRKRLGDEQLTAAFQSILQPHVSIALAKFDVAGNVTIDALWKLWDNPIEFRYRAAFEVFPEFTLQGLDQLSLPTLQPVVIDDLQLDSFIEMMRRERSPWKSAPRASQIGDRIIIDFAGTVEGNPFPGSRGAAARVELGAGGMLPEFEAQLTGISADEERKFSVSFPLDYQTPALAGKTADFELKVLDVQAIDLVALDDAFAQRFGHTDMVAMRNTMRSSLEQQHREQDQRDIATHLLGQLSQANFIPLPDALISRHLADIQQELALQRGCKIEEVPFDEDMIITARRRAQQSILVRKLVMTEEIKVDPAEVSSRLNAIAATASAENTDFVRNNDVVLEQIRAELLQNCVIEWLIARAQRNADTPTS